jgi:hypothetical protein
MKVSFIFGRCIDRYNSIYPVWESASCRHRGACPHTMTHHGEFVKLVLVSKPDYVIRHDLVIMLRMVIRCGVVSHLNEIAFAIVRDPLKSAKSTPVHFAAEQAVQDYHRPGCLFIHNHMRQSD